MEPRQTPPGSADDERPRRAPASASPTGAPASGAPAAGASFTAPSAGERAREGWWVLGLLLPQLVLGAYLGIVPDGIFFRASQVVVLAHVLFGLFSVALFLLLVARHSAGRRFVRSRGSSPTPRALVSHLVAGLALLAIATGLPSLWYGEGGAVARWHRGLGLALALPMVLHLSLEGRRVAAAVTTAALTLFFAASLLLRSQLPSTNAENPAPRAALLVDGRSARNQLALYDPASYCGECHDAIYAEWSRSTHARTLSIPAVPRLFRQHQDEEDARIAGARPGAPAPASSLPCLTCHAPVRFFVDDPRPLFRAPPPIADGVTCSYCHTLRPDTTASFAHSAPESVRRYLGQAAESRVAHAIGNWLIRWRPEVHRRDYLTPYQRTVTACASCHTHTEATWERSRFNTGSDEAHKTLCQDCHMVRAMTGEPVREPGPLVPWGPVRPQRRTHLFLGGNVNAALDLADEELAAREEALIVDRLRLRGEGLRQEAGRLRGRVLVKNELVGHVLPALEFEVHAAWLQVRALDSDGRPLLSRRIEIDGGSGSDDAAPKMAPAMAGASAGPAPTGDTRIQPGDERSFPIDEPLGQGKAARVAVELYQVFSPRPIARTVIELGIEPGAALKKSN